MNRIPKHPGKPQGSDTVPAWLTPGEFVMNAEAARMFSPEIQAMNDRGRAVQAAQGGTIPQMGGVPIPTTHNPSAAYSEGGVTKSLVPEARHQSNYKDWIKLREGLERKVYLDKSNPDNIVAAVGYGHQLPDSFKDRIGEEPYTDAELNNFFDGDVTQARLDAKHNISNFDSLSPTQQGALTNQAFQLGRTGQAGFTQMIKAIEAGDMKTAGAEAIDSNWHGQTPKRSNDLSRVLQGQEPQMEYNINKSLIPKAHEFNKGGTVPQYLGFGDWVRSLWGEKDEDMFSMPESTSLSGTPDYMFGNKHNYISPPEVKSESKVPEPPQYSDAALEQNSSKALQNVPYESLPDPDLGALITQGDKTAEEVMKERANKARVALEYGEQVPRGDAFGLGNIHSSPNNKDHLQKGQWSGEVGSGMSLNEDKRAKISSFFDDKRSTGPASYDQIPAKIGGVIPQGDSNSIPEVGSNWGGKLKGSFSDFIGKVKDESEIIKNNIGEESNNNYDLETTPTMGPGRNAAAHELASGNSNVGAVADALEVPKPQGAWDPKWSGENMSEFNIPNMGGGQFPPELTEQGGSDSQVPNSTLMPQLEEHFENLTNEELGKTNEKAIKSGAILEGLNKKGYFDWWHDLTGELKVSATKNNVAKHINPEHVRTLESIDKRTEALKAKLAGGDLTQKQILNIQKELDNLNTVKTSMEIKVEEKVVREDKDKVRKYDNIMATLNDNDTLSAEARAALAARQRELLDGIDSQIVRGEVLANVKDGPKTPEEVIEKNMSYLKDNSATVEDIVNKQKDLTKEDKEIINNNIPEVNKIVAEGNQDPKALKSAEDYIKAAWGEIFDPKSLAKAAMVYLAGRITGMTGNQALGLAGKMYLTDIATIDKTKKTTAHINKLRGFGVYTDSSLELYRKTGKTSDLVTKSSMTAVKGGTQTKKVHLRLNKNGEILKQGESWFGKVREITMRDYENKSTGTKGWMYQGVPMDITSNRFVQDPSKIPDTDEWKAAKTKRQEWMADNLSKKDGLLSRIDLSEWKKNNEGDDTTKMISLFTNVDEKSAARRLTTWAMINGVSNEVAMELAEIATYDALAVKKKSSNISLNDIYGPNSAFMNGAFVKKKIGNASLFEIKAQDGTKEPIYDNPIDIRTALTVLRDSKKSDGSYKFEGMQSNTPTEFSSKVLAVIKDETDGRVTWADWRDSFKNKSLDGVFNYKDGKYIVTDEQKARGITPAFAKKVNEWRVDQKNLAGQSEFLKFLHFKAAEYVPPKT